jgi:hypothetical protein
MPLPRTVPFSHALARPICTSCLLAVSFAWSLSQAQPPPARQHRSNRSQPVTLVPATQSPPAENRRVIVIKGDTRQISANAIPNHKVGAFPNRGNPHAIAEQTYEFLLPARPTPAAQITWLHRPPDTAARGAPNMPFGVALNGVLFDPGTAEFWNGDRTANWNYEALGGAVPLGLDANHAHVQPNGAYHYHGVPTALFALLDTSPGGHSPLVGWAADGYPIYALRGWSDPKDPRSGVKTLRSSYRLRAGDRPAAPRGPGGAYDGAFIQDYEFVAGSGDLDECNGRFAVTPEFPEGTYAYFLTENWPVIPRAFRGTPISLRGPGGRGGARR